MKPLAYQVIAYGADIVYVINHPVLKHYRTESYMKGVILFVHKNTNQKSSSTEQHQMAKI